jgi:hypothetical protein
MAESIGIGVIVSSHDGDIDGRERSGGLKCMPRWTQLDLARCRNHSPEIFEGWKE